MECLKFVELQNFYFLVQQKNGFAKKIKKLIFDHRVIIERATQTPLPIDPDLTETRGVEQVNSSSSSATSKRKFLFANIDNDIKFCKKSKINDWYNYKLKKKY